MTKKKGSKKGEKRDSKGLEKSVYGAGILIWKRISSVHWPRRGHGYFGWMWILEGNVPRAYGGQAVVVVQIRHHVFAGTSAGCGPVDDERKRCSMVEQDQRMKRDSSLKADE